jgi:serine/threonine-protein kinase
VTDKFERLGNFVLLEKLNSGGMAEVYLAKSIGASGINKFVAVKRILPQYADNREFIEMFKDEAKIAVNLSHNNVVSITDFKAERNQLYLVMEYVQGQNLRQMLQQKKKKNFELQLSHIIFIIKEVSAGLDHAHRLVDKASNLPLNIIHRDMSPQNIMISYEGSVKVIDFGIAKAESQMENTRSGTLKGKFSYMSPEQAEGKSVDQTTDIFSLGIILWELIADDRLFLSNNEVNILRRIKDCDIPDLRKVNPNVPFELERIVKKALAKDRTLRYQNATDLYKDLARFLNKEYPDFTSSEFGNFMKVLFEEDYKGAQDKLVEFSRVSLNTPQKEKNDPENTQIAISTDTQTLSTQTRPTEKSGILDEKNIKGPLGIDENPVATTIHLEDLNQSNKNSNVFKKQLPEENKRQIPEENKTSQPGARTNTLTPRHKKSNGFLDFITYTFMLTVLIFGTKVGFNYLPEKTKKEVASRLSFLSIGSLDQPSLTQRKPPVVVPPSQLPVKTKESPTLVPPPVVPAPPAPTPAAPQKNTVVASITSEPVRAHVFINGVDTGQMTPARITVNENENTEISVFAEGYLRLTKTYKISRDGVSIPFTLQKYPQGEVNIDVPFAGAEVVVFVDGIKLSEKLPIKRYSVPAGIPVHILVKNTFSGAFTEATVQVIKDEKKNLILYLEDKKKD